MTECSHTREKAGMCCHAYVIGAYERICGSLEHAPGVSARQVSVRLKR